MKLKTKRPLNNPFTEADAKSAVLYVLNKYGKDWAKVFEQVYRKETAHFTSLQFKLTGSAGMEVGKWAGKVPTEFVKIIENGPGKEKSFLKWNSTIDFAEYWIQYALRWDGNWARWYSTNATLQNQYRSDSLKVTTRYV